MRLTRLFVQLGVRKLRLTGGEPLLRANLPDLIGDLSAIPGIEDIALTTNGVLLARTPRTEGRGAEAYHRQPGQSRPGRVRAHERRLRRRRRMCWTASSRRARAGLTPVKINAVIQRGLNDHTALELVERFRGTGVIVRFIEYMDVGNRNRLAAHELVVPSQELLDAIAARWPLRAVEPDYRGEVARRYAFEDGAGEIGFISSVTQPFCGDCIARAPVVRRQALHLPVRHRRHRPARAAARRRER